MLIHITVISCDLCFDETVVSIFRGQQAGEDSAATLAVCELVTEVSSVFCVLRKMHDT